MVYLVLADVHGNLPALEAVLAAAARFDEVWCLGDLVGYGAEPDECVELLRQYRHVAVAGNHDWAALGRLDLDDFNPIARISAVWTGKRLTPATRAYLEALPLQLVVGPYTIVHGSVRHPLWEYIDSAAAAWDNMQGQSTPFCLVGHTHVPAVYTEQSEKRTREFLVQGGSVSFALGQGRAVLNPGSVGQPRDGDWRAAFALLDTEKATWTVHRVEYPVEQAQERILRAGLPAQNAFRLAFGR